MPLANPQAPDHLAAEAGSFEPQRVHNFSVEIPLGQKDKDVINLSVSSFKLPKMENEIVTLAFQNGEVYIAGKAKTSGGSIVVKDFVDQDTLGAIMRWRNLVFSSKTDKIGLAKNYKKTVFVVLTGPNGDGVRMCKLSGVFPPADPDFTDLSMSNNGIVELTLTLSCDKTDWSSSITGLV